MKKEKEFEWVNIGLIENAYIELSNPRLTIGEWKQIWKRLKVAVSDEEIKRFNNILIEEYNADRCSKLWIPMPAVVRWFINSMQVELALTEEMLWED